jgi:nucleotide-binding universal stress UspA family protein
MAKPQLFRRILVPHDFSDAATKALEIALELAAGSSCCTRSPR